MFSLRRWLDRRKLRREIAQYHCEGRIHPAELGEQWVITDVLPLRETRRA